MARKSTVLIASDRAGRPAASPVVVAFGRPSAVGSLRSFSDVRDATPADEPAPARSITGLEAGLQSGRQAVPQRGPAVRPFSFELSIEPALLASAGFFLAAGISVGAAQ